jgi:hypothetical protein
VCNCQELKLNFREKVKFKNVNLDKTYAKRSRSVLHGLEACEIKNGNLDKTYAKRSRSVLHGLEACENTQQDKTHEMMISTQ